MFFPILFGFCVSLINCCTIQRASYVGDILNNIGTSPTIFNTPINEKLLGLSSMQNLLENHGNEEVTLSSSNAYSHDKSKSTITNYILSFEDMAAAEQTANETFYLFGNNYDGIWSDISEEYIIESCMLCERLGAKTIGVGGAFSGVSFHQHGPGFAEVLHGHKLWIFFPPERNVPLFHPNMTLLEWIVSIPQLQNIREDIAQYIPNSAASRILENGLGLSNANVANPVDLGDMQYCILGAGELLYFPHGWMHATMNLAFYNTFVSTFLDFQLL